VIAKRLLLLIENRMTKFNINSCLGMYLVEGTNAKSLIGTPFRKWRDNKTFQMLKNANKVRKMETEKHIQN